MEQKKELNQEELKQKETHQKETHQEEIHPDEINQKEKHQKEINQRESHQEEMNQKETHQEEFCQKVSYQEKSHLVRSHQTKSRQTKSHQDKLHKDKSNQDKLQQDKSHQEEQLDRITEIHPSMKIIAHIHTDFPSKFGIPRQSGVVDQLKGVIIFEQEYRNPAAFQGIDGFSYLWLIWEFSESIQESWSPMVRPPRLGGVKKMGVFATRSPFRPNPIGLSCVKLDRIDLYTDQGPVLYVSGIDLKDNTPIYDIKPYLPYTDSHPEAAGGFADPVKDYRLEVEFPEEWRSMIPEDRVEALYGVLAHDPRPAYQNNPDRIYGFEFCEFDIRFTVKDHLLKVCEIVRLK